MSNSNKLKNLIVFSVLFFGLFYFAKISQAATTYEVKDATSANVQAAINKCVDGDSVYMNDDAASWSSDVTITGKAITLYGRSADYKGGSTFTTITSSGGRLILTNLGKKQTVVKDFKIIGSGNLIQTSGTQSQFRVTNILINWSGGYGIEIYNSISNYGCWDNLRFDGSTGSGVYIHGGGTPAAYALDSILGTGNVNIFEDCVWTRTAYAGGSHGVWSTDGGSYVVRYSDLTNWDLDVHGHCSGGGSREFEIYHNNFYYAGSEFGTNGRIVIRGGSGLIYDNNFSAASAGDYGWYLQEVTWGTHCNEAVGGGYCHCFSKDDYPCLYQIGRGKNNTSQKAWYWNNKTNGAYVSIGNWPNNSVIDCADGEPQSTFVQEGRDYDDFETYAEAVAAGLSYTPYTYPHPLRAEAAPPADTTPPSPPTNVSVI